jgi:O-antigen/teichoic acid export membrane protein
VIRSALTAILVAGAVSTLALGLSGLALGGRLGRGLLVFAPWLIPALLQDFWRAILFRDRRGGGAALNDAVYVVAMLISLPLALAFRSTFAVFAVWGIGAAVGAAVGFAQVRIAPAALRQAWRYWRTEIWPFGRWLAAEGTVLAVGSQAIIVVFVSLVGTAAFGGLKAAQTLFAPLSLLTSAASLPGLPALAREEAKSPRDSLRMAVRLSVGVTVLTSLYLVLVGSARTQLLSFLFGDSFNQFARLIFPVGAGQLVLAGGTGFFLLLKARRQGRLLLGSRVVGITSTFISVAALASQFGLVGGAWGQTIGFAMRTLAYLGSTSKTQSWRSRIRTRK